MITGRTIPFGLFGYPVEHTFSPSMHNSAFRFLEIDAIYLPFQVKPENLECALKSLPCLGFKGINITVPHKETCIKYLDEIDKTASDIGAVNTIKVNGSNLIGYNTDGIGFLKSLEEKKIDIDDKKFLILGAGGASRAISTSMLRKKDIKKVYLYDIDLSKSNLLSRDLNKIKPDSSEAINEDLLMQVIDNIDILINATPVGLKDDKSPIDTGLLTGNILLVCDLIYNPVKTKLLKEAEKKNILTLNGLKMLIYQGAASFKIWTGLEPPIQIIQKTILAEINRSR